MDDLPLAELIAERDHHFGPGQVPPTPATTPALIEYLHTLNALRVHLVRHIDAILEGAHDFLSAIEAAELGAIRAGADAAEAKHRWQLVSFNWRRWAIETARQGTSTKGDGLHAAKLANQLLAPDGSCAAGFGPPQHEMLALLTEAYANEQRDQAGPKAYAGSTVKLGPLWQTTKDWADRILLYANAVQRVREDFDRDGDADPTPPSPPPPPEQTTKAKISLPPDAQQKTNTAQISPPATNQDAATAIRLVKATDLPIPRPPPPTDEALQPLVRLQPPLEQPAQAAPAVQDDELVFVETQAVPDFHARLVSAPQVSEAVANRGPGPVAGSPAAAPALERSSQLNSGGYASDYDMINSSAAMDHWIEGGAKPPAPKQAPAVVHLGGAEASLGFAASPAPRRSKRAPSPGLAPPEDAHRSRRSSPRLRPASPVPAPAPAPAPVATKPARQTTKQAFAALKRDFTSGEEQDHGEAAEAAEAAEATQASEEIVSESLEAVAEEASQLGGEGMYTQAAFTQPAFSDSFEYDTQLPATQAPMPGAGLHGSSQSQTESSGLTYASIPSSLLRQTEAEALARVQPVTPAARVAHARAHAPSPGMEHAYLQAPVAWAGYGGETQEVAEPSLGGVARETTSSWDGGGEEERFVGFTQADVGWQGLAD